METRLGSYVTVLAWIVAFSGPASSQVVNLALHKPVHCSSASGGRCPQATDGDFSNVQTTELDDEMPFLVIDLEAESEIEKVIVHNRGDGFDPWVLRDIEVSLQVLAGDPGPEDDCRAPVLPGRETVYVSSLLNPENILGGRMLDGPPSVEVDLLKEVGRRVRARFVQLRRKPDPDLSGSGGEGHPATAHLLVTGEVEVLGTAPASSRTLLVKPRTLNFRGEANGSPPAQTVALTTSDDQVASYDVRSEVAWLRVTPRSGSTAADGTLTASVDGSGLASGRHTGAITAMADGYVAVTLPVSLTVTAPNLALNQPVYCSSSSGGRCGEATDGDFGNVQTTDLDDETPVIVIDLQTEYEVGSVVIHNRGDGFDPFVLRDIGVALQVLAPGAGVGAGGAGHPDELPARRTVYEAALLNPENILGGMTLCGPPSVEVDIVRDVGRSVSARFVAITRVPDPDLFGSGGEGHPATAHLLVTGEVEVFEGSPAQPLFRRGDADTSGVLELTDGVFVLNFLFAGGDRPPCRDAADTDDTGLIELTDGVFLLMWMFLGGPEPPPPGPHDCGADPTADALVNDECAFPPCLKE